MVEHDSGRPVPGSGGTPAQRALLWSRLESLGSRDGGTPATLQALCRVAVQALGCSGAAVSLMPTRAGGLTTGEVVAASDDHARDVEELEFSTSEGPARDALTASRPVLTADMEQASGRWLAYAPAAMAAGVCASYAFPMHVGAVRLGVLHLHCAEPRRLATAEVATCLILTEMATEIVLGAGPLLAAGGSSEALTSGQGMRDQIYQAQGMVSVDLGVSLVDALARLRAHAFGSGQDLAALAAAIVAGETRLTERDE